MRLPSLSLNHLNLPARDPEALRKWYVDKLGFTARGSFLWSGATLLVFVEGEPIESDRVHFGFRIDSMTALAGWVEALRGRGVAVGEVESDDSYARVYVKDPEGNTFELFYEPLPV